MNIPIAVQTSAKSATPAAASIGEPSFADALIRIAEAGDLAAARKRHWSTSLRQMAIYLDRPVATIPARVAAIASAVKALHPEQVGVNAKTFANHRANVRAGLLWFNRQTHGSGRDAPMAPAYRALLDRITDRHVRDILSPFFRFLTSLGVEPRDVADADADRFVAARRDFSFRGYKVGQHRSVVRHWNACAGAIDGWPPTNLSEPALAKTFVGPGWNAFPDGLRADIDAYLAGLAKRRKNAKGRILRPCAPSTIATRRRELVAAVRAGVEAGLHLDDLRSLSDLLRPDRVETIIEWYWEKNGEVPALYTIDLGARLLDLARQQPGFDPDDLDRLDEIRTTLDQYRSNGLTEKNRTLVRAVIQGNVWPKVIALPARLMAEARADATRSPMRSAVAALLAAAVRILTVAPIRMKNLAAIQLGENLVRPGGPGTTYTLIFADYDVKNRVPLEFPLDSETTALIDEFAHHHRPRLMHGRNHDYLFPGEAHDQRGAQGLGELISGRLWKILGLAITPHQFRHAAAGIILTAEPGNYELVRRVLGHRNIQTTINFYVGLETIAATRRFGEMVTAAMVDVPAASSRRSKKERNG